jgi:hypothetical protein
MLALSLRLESENQQMRAQLTRRQECDKCDKHDETKPAQKAIPLPENKTDITVELIRQHLGLAGGEHDLQWSKIWVRIFTTLRHC